MIRVPLVWFLILLLALPPVQGLLAATPADAGPHSVTRAHGSEAPMEGTMDAEMACSDCDAAECCGQAGCQSGHCLSCATPLPGHFRRLPATTAALFFSFHRPGRPDHPPAALYRPPRA